MHSAHQEESVKNCVKIMNKFSFQFLQPYESCLNLQGPLDSRQVGLTNEHLTVLVIAGCESHWWWIFKGGKEIGQIT